MTSRPYVRNAADEKQVKGAARKRRLDDEQAANDLRSIMSTREGRRFLWRQLGKCRIYESSVEHSGSMTFFNEGVRSVGTTLLNEITSASPRGWLEMQAEAHAEAERLKEEQEQPRPKGELEDGE